MSRTPRGIEAGLEPQEPPSNMHDTEMRIWRTSIVPVFGPFWILLPFCVWLLGFGADLIAPAGGVKGIAITATAASLVLGGWGFLGGLALSRRLDQAGRGRGPATSMAVSLAGSVLFAVILSSRLGMFVVPVGFCLCGLLFIGFCLLRSGEPVRRVGLVVMLHLLVGAGFLYVIGSGIVPVTQPLPRALIGAGLLLFAYVGWTGITSCSRRLALAYVRKLRGESND